MAVRFFDLGQVPATPWKNGGGATRELACWPEGADMDHFDWRVSVATIAQSGPFSRFAEVDRVITLLGGDGVHLRQAESGIDHRLDQPLQPFAFAGDGGMDCDLLGSLSTDFNLMLRRGRWRGAVQVLRHAADLPALPAGLLLAVQGACAITPLAGAADTAGATGKARVLQPECGLWWAGEECAWAVAPQTAEGAALLHVALQAA